MAIEVWGPPAGSSLVVLDRSPHGRIRIVATTDFGEANCGFNDAQARRIRDALNVLLGDVPEGHCLDCGSALRMGGTVCPNTKCKPRP